MLLRQQQGLAASCFRGACYHFMLLSFFSSTTSCCFRSSRHPLHVAFVLLVHFMLLSFFSSCHAISFFTQLGALQRLNRMLASPMLHIKQHSALSLSFLCSTNSTAQLAAVEAGALSVVQNLFRSNRTHVVVTALRFIFNIACVASVILPRICSCMSHPFMLPAATTTPQLSKSS